MSYHRLDKKHSRAYAMTTKISPDHLSVIDELAKESGMTRSEYVRSVIYAHIENNPENTEAA